MPNRFDLLIFDWDGTLMDSAERIATCFSQALADSGWPLPPLVAIRRMIGLGVQEALARLLPAATDAQRARVAGRYREYFLHLDTTPTPLFPGVRAGLTALHARGYGLAVATGKSRQGLSRALLDSGLGPLFRISRCADETRSKPDPLMLTEILAATATDPARALMIGDTSYDMEMAQRAGIARVAVTYGVHDEQELCFHGPQACVDSFGALCAWLS